MALPTIDSCPVTRNRGALLKNRNEEFINSSMAEGIMIFTGEDITYSSTKWAQDIEDNAEIFSWTAQQKLIIARRSLTGTAELWLRSEKMFKTYEELKSALQREFPDTVNMKEMHEIMSKRRKLKHESCYQYMLIMKELGKRAKFPDNVVIQYIIDGLPDYEQNKTILYGVTSFSMLKEQLSIYEKIQQKSRHQRERVVSNEKYNIKQKAGYSKTSPQHCYKCGEKGHMANQCIKGVKCFKCNSYGHIASHCIQGQDQDGSRRKVQNVNLYSLEVGANDVKPESSSFNQEHILEVSANDTKPQLSMSTCDNSDNVNNNNIFTIDEKSVKTNNKCVISVQIQEQWLKCLLDTGSDVNLVSVNVYRSLNVKKCSEENVKLVGLGHYTTRSIGKFFTNIIVDGFSYYTHFYIVPQGVIPYNIILGQPFLASTILTIDKGTVIVRPISYDSSYLNCLPTNTEADNISNITEVQSLINNYKPKKIKEAPIKMRIVLKNDIPVVQRPRRLALKEEEIVKKQIDEWLEKGIIRPSYSEYSSPLVLVPKKDGTVRVCVDYRKLNQRMVKDEYPLPIIEDQIDKLTKVTMFSTLDLKNAFFHLPIEEESIKYTAFVTTCPEGQYEFLRAPFGLSICPKYFMRYINIIFREFIARGSVLIFLDDLILLSQSEQEGLMLLRQVLSVAADYGLEINWKKSQLLQRSVEYLGYVIANVTVKPSREKLEAVERFPEPKNLKQLHSFLGLTSYFRKFIPNYAIIARPLSDLLKKGEFYFESEHKSSFELLKSKLCCDPVLKIFDIQLDTELHTDASKYGYSAILMQKDPADGSMHPVHYMSRKTNENQQKCSSYELEALAVIEGVKKFRKYLLGIKFKIITDCEAFQKTLNKKDVPAKIARWILYLQDFDFSIVHRTGDKMKHVDSLSRNISIIQTELIARISQAQDEDETLKTIKHILKEKNQYEDYILDNNIIYKGEEKKLVIPELMDMEIIKKAHGNGHFGKTKIKYLIEKDYYIKGLDSKIEKVILNCIPCILASRKSGKKEGFLNPIDKGDLPLQTLHCDHLGPLDSTKKMYNYILTVMDAYTKFVWIYPVKSTTSKETVDKLKLHQQDFGNPRRIITDRGTAFTGREFIEYCENENIQHVKITTGVPRGNGQVERMNKIIISVLSKMSIGEPANWYKYVSKLQRAINGTYQRSINTSPFELLLGTTLRSKEDLNIIELLEEENRRLFTEKRDELRKEAKEHILKIQEENRKSFNKRRKESYQYKEGDLVAIQRTQFGPNLKIKPKYFGPYQVIKKLGKDRYEVHKINNNTEGPKKTTTAVDYIKKWPHEMTVS